LMGKTKGGDSGNEDGGDERMKGDGHMRI